MNEFISGFGIIIFSPAQKFSNEFIKTNIFNLDFDYWFDNLATAFQKYA
ncbi:Hypothetical protein IALB_1816 [Ignavibacterium album JCM 16511]|uniref:Uncharacterized protein n=1 Tax=Ignavibacterium album (strain DSM 19864 / JCM 16511 / NBRC 101810 / Mat9-16) TaxID=945713 RepID=I0AKL6_IGNAJ|nr:Hypothetical protein IALB_1816 [Ignavibacterium album JCM 16511]